MTLIPQPDFRPGYAGFCKAAPESPAACPIAADSLSDIPAPAANTFSHCGWQSLPVLNEPENPEVIHAVGSYRGEKTVPGWVEPTAQLDLTVGNSEFLRYALRSSGLPGFHGLPVLALAVGADNYSSTGYSPTGFTRLLRYAMCNSLTLSCSEGAGPVKAAMEFWGIAVDPDAPKVLTGVYNTPPEVETQGWNALCWQHMDWKIGDSTYRSFLKSVQIQVNNRLRRSGVRLPCGDADNPLTGTSLAIYPGTETVSVSYVVHDLPFRYDGGGNRVPLFVGSLGPVELVATSNNQIMKIQIDNSHMGQKALQRIAPGEPFGFEASTLSRVIRISKPDGTF
jgi:hypothetical protein